MDVHESAKFISKLSKNVKINEFAVDRCSKQLVESFYQTHFSLDMWNDHPLHPVRGVDGTDEDICNWIFLMDSLNFCFWGNAKQKHENELFYINYRNNNYTGYWSLCAAIRRAKENPKVFFHTFPAKHQEQFEQENVSILSAKWWKYCTKQTVELFFSPHCQKSESQDEPIVQLLDERWQIIHQIGNSLSDEYHGNFAEFIIQCNFSAKTFLDALAVKFPSYNDIAVYHNETVRLMKRAQILVADLWGCFRNEKYGYFKDIDRITMFADYRVPQSLVYFGVLEYSNELMDKLKNNIELKNGDPFEIEIRGCTIHSGELLRDKMVELSKEYAKERTIIINSITIDFYLWNYAKRYQNEMSTIPIHHTKSIYY